MYASKRNLKIG